MSVLLEFSMFPTDKGESVSKYVSEVIEMVARSGYDYRLTAMGTIVETETLAESLRIIQNSYEILEPQSSRVYSSLKIDIRKGSGKRLEGKIKSVEDKIGKVKR